MSLKLCMSAIMALFSGCFKTETPVKHGLDITPEQYAQNLALQDYAQNPRVVKYTLQNGLTILVCPQQNAATVSVQMWYHVGSQDEGAGQRGMAHFLEHMIFKGTKTMSEVDIATVLARLSGYLNAFTSYDYTTYVFDVPVANWSLVLPILADSMQNTKFDPQHINSEVKAVIQELKMYKDYHERSLCENCMIPAMFPVHAYHHPIVGYKQDLLNMTHDSLMEFYKEFYIPNNATLVVVGDVNPDEVASLAAKNFAGIARGKDIVRNAQIDDERLVSHDITMYQDVAQPLGLVSYKLPGFIKRQQFSQDVLSCILAQGNSSRLYKKLVDELQLVVSVSADAWDLADSALLFISYQPVAAGSDAKIIAVIQEELDVIALQGVSPEEVQRAQNLTAVAYQKKLENVYDLACEIGKAYTLLGDAQYAFTAGQGLGLSLVQLQEQIQYLVQRYCKASLRCTGQVLPVAQQDREFFKELQKESDAQDAKIIHAKVRTAPVEQERYAKTIRLNARADKQFPHPVQYTLPNGLEVYLLPTTNVDLVSCALEYKERGYLQPDDKLGIADVTAQMLLEGTKNLPQEQFAQRAESFGISFNSTPGSVTANWLSANMSVGLELLADLVCQPDFTQKALDKIKTQLTSDIDVFWDTQKLFVPHLLNKAIYKNHALSRTTTKSTVASITLADVQAWYDEKISPQGACLILVGKFNVDAAKQMIEKTFGAWQGPTVPDYVQPELKPLTEYQEQKYYTNRDQTYVAFGGLSVNRLDADYLPLQLFYQIFSVGMNSRVFMLRQQTGLFYTGYGELTNGAFDVQGKIFIRCLVSNEKIDDVKKMFLQEIDHAIDSLTDAQLQEAKNNIYNNFDLLYDKNDAIASALENLYRLHLPFDFYNQQIAAVQKITKEQVVAAVKKYLASDKMICIQAGRTGDLQLPQA